jgi:hypothetical protein
MLRTVAMIDIVKFERINGSRAKKQRKTIKNEKSLLQNMC